MKINISSLSAKLVILFYAALIIIFHQVNYYENHFELTGISVVVYNASRVLIIFGFLLIAYQMGHYLIRKTHRESSTNHGLEYFLKSFMIGISLIQIVTFALGLMGLLKWNIVIVPLLIILISCHQTLTNLTDFAIRNLRCNRLIYTIPAMAFLTFLTIRGQYPLGGHDYYTHYFDYVKEAVKTGSFNNNISWNHFYYLKGMSLFFLGSILTDPLAPSVMTSLLALVGMLIIYQIIKDSGVGGKISLIISVIYITLFTIGIDELEKQHAPLAVFMLGIFWLSTKLLDQYVQKDIGCVKLPLILVVIVTIIITPQIAILILLYFILFYLYCLYQKTNPAKDILYIGLWVITTPLLIFFINYKITGIPHEQYINLLWRYLDLNKILELGIIHQVIVTHYIFEIVNSAGYSDIIEFSRSHFMLIFKFMRLDLFWPLFVAAPFYLYRIFSNKNQVPKIIIQRLTLIVCFTVSTLAIILLAGTAQRFSLYRLFGFFYPIPLIIIGYLWVINLNIKTTKNSDLVGKILIFVSVISLLPLASLTLTERPELKWASQYRGNNDVGLKNIVNNGLRFATGEFSIKDAYQHQLGWEGKHPTGGIYPPMYEVWKRVGNAAVVSFHIHDYCMMPNCNVLRPTTHRFGKSWETLYVFNNGTVEEVKASLKSEGLNFFFISFEIPFWAKQHSNSLFNPESIKNELEIVWSDESNYLLSWKGNGGYEVTDEFIQKFNEKYWENRLPNINRAVDKIFNHIKNHENKLDPFQLPWCSHCSGLVKLD